MTPDEELREIREKMERGELQDPRIRPEPTPLDRYRGNPPSGFSEVDVDDDPGLPLGWEGIEPVDGDDLPLTHDHTDESWWADHLIRRSGCVPPTTHRRRKDLDPPPTP